MSALESTITCDRSWALACFDLDGTLVPGTSTGQHIATRLGHSSLMGEVETLYSQGKVTNFEVAERDGAHYAGYNTSDIEILLRDVPLIADIKETVDYLGSCGIPSILSTVAWRFVAEIIANRFGFVAWCGPELSIDENGRFTGEVSRHFDENDKRDFVERYCAQRNIPLNRVFAVGDSRSDITLFNAVGYSVALNGNEIARKSARIAIASDTLLDVLPLIPGLIPSNNFHLIDDFAE